MNKVIVAPGQTLLDVALQHTGSPMGIVKLAKLNGLTIGQPIEPGTLLLVGDVIDEQMVEAIRAEGITVASAWPREIQIPVGASNWILATGFWNDSGIWLDDEIWID